MEILLEAGPPDTDMNTEDSLDMLDEDGALPCTHEAAAGRSARHGELVNLAFAQVDPSSLSIFSATI